MALCISVPILLACCGSRCGLSHHGQHSGCAGPDRRAGRKQGRVAAQGGRPSMHTAGTVLLLLVLAGAAEEGSDPRGSEGWAVSTGRLSLSWTSCEDEGGATSAAPRAQPRSPLRPHQDTCWRSGAAPEAKQPPGVGGTAPWLPHCGCGGYRRLRGREEGRISLYHSIRLGFWPRLRPQAPPQPAWRPWQGREAPTDRKPTATAPARAVPQTACNGDSPCCAPHSRGLHQHLARPRASTIHLSATLHRISIAPSRLTG